MSSIAIIQGHPDSSKPHFCHALANAYREGAEQGGHQADIIAVAELDFPLLRSREEWKGDLPASLSKPVDIIQQADHLVIFYPLWLGTMPALLKAFIEQVFRPGVALDDSKENEWPKQLLKGKSCRVVVTMGMPGTFYRWYYRAHSLKSLERNILKFSGISPVRETIYGLVEGASDAKRGSWLEEMKQLGHKAR
ncbi:MAG: NAD(P)H-dependent oxidoreductase [Gammaproteobacteria bacterium]|nr:NAD(P)H-dependent oxidoreductase [Gammaproteobacteria bacterium]